MKRITLSFEGQSVALRYPESFHDDISTLFADNEDPKGRSEDTVVLQKDDVPGLFALRVEGGESTSGLDRETCLGLVLGEVVHALVTDLGSGVAVHSGAVSWQGQGILLPGASGAGKSSLVAWLVGKGFDYLSDELAVLRPDVPKFAALARPMVVKNGASISMKDIKSIAGAGTSHIGSNIVCLPRTRPPEEVQPCRFVVFPRFEEGAELSIEPLSAAQSGLELTACNVNARNLPDHGFGTITSFASNVPAVMLRYGGFDQLEGVLDMLLKLAAEGSTDAQRLRRLMLALATPSTARDEQTCEFPPRPRKSKKAPEATPRGDAKKLTIGMATYDDYDGVFFTLQSLRMYHPEIIDDCELLVVDNNPTGPCAEPLKALENHIPNYRYVPFQDRVSTTTREVVFEEAAGEFVLCMDCHVFVVPGALEQLLIYFDENPDTNDLLQGPLVYDDLATYSTHFEPAWREGMYGYWETDERAKDPDAEPFAIPMQGLGLFACRRAVWPGFNTKFRGFGGEEGYIHEKFRQAGSRTLCLPFLRWLHRFDRPMGVPYDNTWDDRIRNYMIGFGELGMDSQSVIDHFTEFLGPEIAKPIFKRILADLPKAETGRS